MGNRRRSRELAMQALFQMEMNQDDSREAVELFCRHFGVTRNVKPFFLQLVEGVKKFQHELMKWDGPVNAAKFLCETFKTKKN